MAGGKISGIDSEIALTAMLATSVTYLPAGALRFDSLFKVVAIGLLFLTLLRRMAVMQGQSPEWLPFRASTYILDIATYLSLLYVLLVIIRRFSISFGVADLFPLLFGVFAPLIVFLSFLGWELLFRAGLREGERTIQATAGEHHGELLGVLLSRLARFVQSERVYGEEYTTQTELSSFHDSKGEHQELSPEQVKLLRRHILVTLAVLFISIGGYLILIPISQYIFSGGWLTSGLLLLTIVVTSGFVRLWYSMYGLVKVEERNGFLTFGGDAITYLLLSWILLS